MTPDLNFTLYSAEYAPQILNASATAAGLAVTWGRTQLTDAPMNRVLTATLAHAKKLPPKLLPARIYAELNGTCIFDGIIDTVNARNFPDAPIHSVRATENASWWSAWGRVLDLPARSSSYTGQEIQTALDTLVQAPENILSPGSPVPPPRMKRVLFGATGPIQTPAKQGYETLIKSTPLAQPAWSPAMDVLEPTTHTPKTTPANVTTIPANRIGHDRSLTLTAQNCLGSVEWTMAGDWNTPKNTFTKLVPGTPTFGLRRGNLAKITTPLGRSGTTTNAAINNLITPALELLALQITPPRKITLSTHRTNLPQNLLTPWETGQTIHIPNDPIATWLTDTPDAWLRPIGGTLTIHKDRIDHDLTCIWVNQP